MKEEIPITRMAVRLWKDTPNKPDDINDDWVSMAHYCVPVKKADAEYKLVQVEDRKLGNDGMIIQEAKYDRVLDKEATFKEVNELPCDCKAEDGWLLWTIDQYNEYCKETDRAAAIAEYQLKVSTEKNIKRDLRQAVAEGDTNRIKKALEDQARHEKNVVKQAKIKETAIELKKNEAAIIKEAAAKKEADAAKS